jgi:hypothetical protein
LNEEKEGEKEVVQSKRAKKKSIPLCLIQKMHVSDVNK